MSSALISGFIQRRAMVYDRTKAMLDRAGDGPMTESVRAQYEAASTEIDQIDEDIRAYNERAARADVAAEAYRHLDDRTGGRLSAAENRSVGIIPPGVTEVRSGALVAYAAKRAGLETRANELLTTSGVALSPDQIAASFIDRVKVLSTFAASSGQVLIDAGHDSYTFPIVTGDATAAQYAENATIGNSKPSGTSLTVAPGKWADIQVVSNEAENDLTPDTASLVQMGGLRAIVKAYDKAAFEGNGTHGTAPFTDGVDYFVTPATAIATAPTSLDFLMNGMNAIRSAGYNPTDITVTPGLLALMKTMKTGSGYNTYLFTGDTFDGATIHVNNNLTVTSNAAKFYVWDRSVVFNVVKLNAEVLRSEHYAYAQDGVAYRFIYRAAPAVVDALGVYAQSVKFA